VRLTLGTRGSPLALWQARHIAARLADTHAGLTVDIKIIKTEGDRRLDVPLASGAGKGVFVKELEDALYAGSIDLAVHSLKDLPTATPAGLTLGAIPERYDPRDALVSPTGGGLDSLSPSALVATGSPRRRAQLLAARRDLRFTLVRGNVDTRVRKLNDGAFDALVLAVAGLGRLGITAAPYVAIPTEVCLPAAGQGALAVETRADDAATNRLVARLDDPKVRAAVVAERAFLDELGAGCLAPAGALARVSDGSLSIEAMVAMTDGSALRRERHVGATARAEQLGREVAARVIADGGEAILIASREGGDGA
jgi:hydroxymethylbilane synthase